jgi:hypothetical protein
MTAKPSILHAAESVVGAPVRDAVLVIFRRTWAWVTFALGFGAGLIISKIAGVNSPFDFAIAGGLGGLGLQSGMVYRFLVRTENQLFLTSSKRWVGRPKELIGPVDPHSITVQKGVVNRKVTIGGEAHQMSRLFESRLRAMIDDLQQANPPNVPPGYTPYQG